MPRLLLANDEVMEFFNTLTLARQPLSTPRPPTARRSTNPRPPHVTFCLASVKGFNKTNTSSLGESNSRMMVRSSPKLFWNGVPDRIIRNKRRIILSGTPFQNNFAELRTNMPRLLLANDEVMDFFNTLTLARQPLDPSTLDCSAIHNP